MDIIAFGAAVGIPVLRSIGGWITNALEDGKIEQFEVMELAKTVLKTGIYGTMVFFGAEGFGIDIEPVAAAATGVILDIVISAIKKK